MSAEGPRDRDVNVATEDDRHILGSKHNNAVPSGLEATPIGSGPRTTNQVLSLIHGQQISQSKPRSIHHQQSAETMATRTGVELKERRGSTSIFDAFWKRGHSASRRRRKSEQQRPDSERGSDSDTSSKSAVVPTLSGHSSVSDAKAADQSGRQTWRSGVSTVAIDEADLRDIEFRGGESVQGMASGGRPAVVRPSIGLPPTVVLAPPLPKDDFKIQDEKKSGLKWQQRMKKRFQGLSLGNNNNNGDHGNNAEQVSGNDNNTAYDSAVDGNGCAVVKDNGSDLTTIESDAASSYHSRRRHTLKDGVRRLRIPFLTRARSKSPAVHSGQLSSMYGSGLGAVETDARNQRLLEVPGLTDDGIANRMSADCDDGDDDASAPSHMHFRSRAASDTTTLQSFRRHTDLSRFSNPQTNDNPPAHLADVTTSGHHFPVEAAVSRNRHSDITAPNSQIMAESVSGERDAKQKPKLRLATDRKLSYVTSSSPRSRDLDTASDKIRPRVHFKGDNSNGSSSGVLAKTTGNKRDVVDVISLHSSPLDRKQRSAGVARQRTISMPDLMDDNDSLIGYRGRSIVTSRNGKSSVSSASPTLMQPNGRPVVLATVRHPLSEQAVAALSTIETQHQHQRVNSKKLKQSSNGQKDSRLRRATSVLEQQAIITTMFGRKSHGDAKKSAAKILDPRKDTVTRLKHLRIVLESYDVNEAKALFEQYYSCIYYLFHDGFTNVEASLTQRASKAHREELDFMLFILEKILTLLPEMIHKRWQMHSIGRIMRKLLHTGNSLKLRREGMRLFLLWYEILMDNATEECHRMFRSLVPKIGLGATENSEIDLFTVRTFPNSKVSAPDIYPILPPQTGDKHQDNPSKWMLENLLFYMVSEVNKIEWNNHELHEYGFNFLFDKFKEYYLHEIFVDFKKTSIYEPNLELPEKRLDLAGIQAPTLLLCQETVVKWFANFTLSSNKSPIPSPLGLSAGNTTSSALASKKAADSMTVGESCGTDVELSLPTVSETEPSNPGGSNASTMSNVSSYNEHESNGSSVCSGGEEHSLKEYEIVRNILYATRENINIIHEVYRQAFMFSFHYAGSLRKVICVYRNWLQSDSRPIFMLEPIPTPNDVDSRNGVPISSDKDASNWLASSIHCPDSARGTVDVRAGLQRLLQVFITNSANVFLLETVPVPGAQRRDTAELVKRLEDQVDICKRVLNIYRYMVMNVKLDKTTWEQLLMVLLKITSSVLTETPPVERDRSLGGRLAEHLFKTLIVSWIKANLNIVVSDQLWEHYLKVLSSLTGWVQLIREWAKTMDMLTRVLARHVYSLDLHDLPLDKLSEQKSKRLRGARTGSLKSRDRGQGRGWLKQVSADNPVTVPSSETASSLTDSNQQIFVGSRISVRQRSRSGESPVGLSQNDVNHLAPAVSNVVASNAVASLIRSSSDSSILMLPDKGLHKSVMGMDHDGDVFDTPSIDMPDTRGRTASITCLASRANDQSDRRISDPLNGCDVVIQSQVIGSDSNVLVTLQPSDTVSLASTDSQLPYQKMDDSNSFNFERGSYSDDRSDTEALLRISDSGSFSSNHSSFRRSQRTSRDMRPLSEKCNGTVVSEEMDILDESEGLASDMIDGNDDATEEARNEEPTTGNDVVSLDEDGAATDEEDEIEDTMHSFEDPPNAENERRDRDSLRIDDSDVLTCRTDDSRRSGKLSVLAGGSLTGWTPEVAVVLWQRMLGSLGNINQIRDPKMHEHVYEYLCDLVDTLIKLRNNQGVTKDNQSTPAPPSLVPPVLITAPWLFEALSLSSEYQGGKLLAFQLLCKVTLRQHDVELPIDHLLRFYMALHHGLVHCNQDTVNVLVRYCQSRFFALPLPGSTMMILDLIHGANTVLSLSGELKDSPRAEAMSLLGSLLCLPNHFDEISVLQPNEKELTVMNCADVKDHVINLLLKFGRREPSETAGCIAVCSLGIFLHVELSNGTMHQKIKEAIGVLISTLRLNEKASSQVATHVMVLLSEHVDLMLAKIPDLPVKIIEELVGVIAFLYEKSSSESSNKFSSQVLVSVIFCLLEWCMRLPSSVLMNSTASSPVTPAKALLHKVFDVLTLVVLGGSESRTVRLAKPQSDLTILEQAENESSLSPSHNPDETQTRSVRTARVADVETGKSATESSGRHVVKLAARTVMMHLLNYFGHFPLGSGATQLSSSVHELSSISGDLIDDVKQASVLSASNIQFFVFNNTTLISFIEIPVEDTIEWNKVTAGLTTVKKVCRVIIRDPSGKFAWDSAILYGPPNCRSGSYPPEPHQTLRIVEDADLIGQQPTESTSVAGSNHQSQPVDLEQYDLLEQTLQYVERTSPECVLHVGEHLNAPFHAPTAQLPCRTEDEMKEGMLIQQSEEGGYLSSHSSDSSVTALPMEPSETPEDSAIFHLCRLFLNQLGFMAWEKRQHFDLLRRSDRLLRDLKHLDSQHCRDTHKIAVIYVADGQEDKTSILSNKTGSLMFQQFVAALGWPVDLETHTGFMGGLQRNQTTGTTAPYYATSTKEVLFHVSTQMPSDTEEDQLRKLKHLGNDEVHIVWSEHSRDYRRGIIQTEFGDVMIVIYPTHQSTLFRIQIICQSEVPFFGPLFDGAIVDFVALPGLVRATAINAGTMIRTLKPYYQPFYEERMRYVETLVQQHKLATMYETFAAQVYSPVFLQGDSAITPTTSFNDKLQPVQMGKATKVNATRMKWRRASEFVLQRGGGTVPYEAEEGSFHRKLSLGRPKKSSAKNSAHRASPPRSPNLDSKGKR